MTALLRKSHIFVAQKTEEISMKTIIFEKFIWCPSKYYEMKILLPVTSAKIWPESGMLTVNSTIKCKSSHSTDRTSGVNI